MKRKFVILLAAGMLAQTAMSGLPAWAENAEAAAETEIVEAEGREAEGYSAIPLRTEPVR